MRIFTFGTNVGGPITDLAWGGQGYATAKMFAEAAKPTEATYKFPEYVKQIDVEMPKFIGKKMTPPNISASGKVGVAVASIVTLGIFGKVMKDALR